jgi:hypothetical protein
VQPHWRALKNKFLIPRYKIISPHIKEALRKYMGKVDIYNPYCGLPLCVGDWWRYLDHCQEFHINNFIIKEKIQVPPDVNKIKLFVCDKCDLRNYCNGIWKEYPSIHPYIDIKPLKFKGGISDIIRQ